MHVYVCVVHVCACTCVCLHDLTTQAKLGLLERLAQGVVVGDGGMIWTMEMRGYATAGRYTPEVAVENSAAGMGLWFENSQKPGEGGGGGNLMFPHISYTVVILQTC